MVKGGENGSWGIAPGLLGDRRPCSQQQSINQTCVLNDSSRPVHFTPRLLFRLKLQPRPAGFTQLDFHQHFLQIRSSGPSNSERTNNIRTSIFEILNSECSPRIDQARPGPDLLGPCAGQQTINKFSPWNVSKIAGYCGSSVFLQAGYPFSRSTNSFNMFGSPTTVLMYRVAQKSKPVQSTLLNTKLLIFILFLLQLSKTVAYFLDRRACSAHVKCKAVYPNSKAQLKRNELTAQQRTRLNRQQESPAVADKPARRLRKVCTVYVRAVGL